jgi:GT2 family glycosyltransferase
MIRAVVVTFNSGAIIEECLRSLLSIAPEADEAGGLEIVVVDNASADDTVARATAVSSKVQVLATGGNLGYAAAINRGWQSSSDGAHLLILNPDIRLSPGAIREMFGVLGTNDEQGRRIGLVFPRLVDESGGLHSSLRRTPTAARTLGEAVLGGDRAGRFDRWGERVTRPEPYEHAATVDWASGAALLVDRAAFDELGAWDESFFLYSEETEFCLRAADRGWAVRYIPTAEATHLGGELHSSARLYALLVANRVLLQRQRRGRMAGSLMRAASIVNEILRLHRPGGLHRFAMRTLIGGDDARRSIIRSLREPSNA